MFNKIKSKYLIIAFLALLAMVLLLIPENNNKRNQSFKSELFEFDTASISTMAIYPKAKAEMISFEKSGSKWMVSDSKGKYNADNDQIKNMIFTLSKLKAKRLAAKGKDSWGKFELTDSLGTRVKLMSGKKTAANIYIGKFSYTQPSQPANPYQRTQGTMTSYVRLSGEKEVYAVDGFLSMNFNRQVKDFRNHKVLQIQKENLNKITVTAPNKNFTLTRNDNNWMANGLVADSASVANYISGLSHLSSSNFLAEDNKPMGAPTHSINFEGENGGVITKIDAFYTDSTSIAISSSLNPGTYFDGTKNDLFKKLFTTDFLKKNDY